MNKKIIALFVGSFVLTGSLFVANNTQAVALEKINICHSTSSEINPWNAIQIDSNAWTAHQGHGDFIYDGPITDAGQPTNQGDDWCENNVPATTATISATKIVCDNESDLPNWGAGAPETITAQTAANFLENNESCRLASGWQFEWAPSGTLDGGPETIGHVSGYTPFGPTNINGVATAIIPLTGIGDRIWVREILKDGYIPFTGQNTTQNVSAEFYCHEDGLNYDNYDFIANPQGGQTYHCVAWNVLKPKPEIKNSCPLPSATANSVTDTTEETITANSETSLQAILDAYYTTLNAVSDQKQYQEWNSALSQQITVSPKFLSRNAGWNAVFGYYKNGDINTFVPIFRTGNVNPADTLGNAAPLATNPSDVFVVTSTGASKIGFALKAWDGSSYHVSATQNTLSDGGLDRALVYNTSPDTYALAFEDSIDWDYNDLVVQVSLACMNVTPQVCTLWSDTDTKVIEIKIGNTASSTVNQSAFNVTETSITDAFWTADVDGPFTTAKWIWSEDPVTDWETEDKYITFSRTFSVTEAGTSAKLNVAADNEYTAYLDGIFLGANNSATYQTVEGDSIYIPTLSVGSHTLTFVVKNRAQQGSALNNPGGLLFNLSLTNETCTHNDDEDPRNNPPTITLLGNTDMTLTIGQTFTDPGVRAQDAEDFVDVTYPATTNGFSVTGQPGAGPLPGINTYTILYKYTDSHGADSPTVTRTLHVVAGQTQCSDGIDNDEDGFTDTLDTGCHTDGDVGNPNSYDPNDNNESTLVDVCSNLEGNQSEVPSGYSLNDGICTENQPPIIQITPTSNGPQASRSGSSRRSISLPPPMPQVLGASTDCGMYITDYIKYGAKNNPEEVTKLQSFLNEYLGANLTLNGFYDLKTFEAVKKFQLKHNDEVLTPWVKIGLHNNANTPTGYVYKTTQRMINEIVCPALGLPIPDLSDELSRR